MANSILPRVPPVFRPPSETIIRPLIQRMEAPSGTGSSGRTAGVLWDHFVKYSNQRAKDVMQAFQNAGYTIHEMRGQVIRAITELKLDLAAHRMGGSDSGTQGDYEKSAIIFESKLIAWAGQHPKGTPSSSSGSRHSEAEEKACAAKKAAGKQQNKDDKHMKYHADPANRGKRCATCNNII